MKKCISSLFLIFFCFAAFGQENNDQLYHDMVNYYQHKLSKESEPKVEKSPLDATKAFEAKSNEGKISESAATKRIKALQRIRNANTELGRLEEIKVEALRKEREERERKVKEAKVQHLLKALGYDDLADEMKTEVYVDAPL